MPTQWWLKETEKKGEPILVEYMDSQLQVSNEETGNIEGKIEFKLDIIEEIVLLYW